MTSPLSLIGEEAVARAIWDARERRFPERVRRAPDAMDQATDAWTYCAQDAGAAISAHLAALKEAGWVLVDMKSRVRQFERERAAPPAQTGDEVKP